MIDIGKTQADFCTEWTNENTFKADLVFNYTEWHKSDNHMPFVKEEEKAADSENSVEGYEFNGETTLTIVSTAENERDISA